MARLEAILDGRIDSDSAAEADRLLEQRLGVHIPAMHELENAINGDLDPARFGIGWWAPHPDDKRRIFISDYLVQCANSVSTNLLEAEIHRLAAEDAHEQENAHMAHAVSLRKVGRGSFAFSSLQIPAPTNFLDLLPQKLADLHVAGFFRAIGSALDTFAAVSIGVGALETPIVRADLGKLRQNFRRSFPKTPGGNLQERVKTATIYAIESAGPNGWLEWTLGYRNMLVHRGRRAQYHNLARAPGPVLFSPADVPMPRIRVTTHLARDPENSDLQALFGGGPQPSRITNVLEEDGFIALKHTLDAVLFVVKEAARTLLDVWRERRSAPDSLTQPRQQWPQVSIEADRFSGFEPGTVPVSPDSMYASPTNVRRLMAAAVDSNNQHRWKTFSG